MSLIRHKHPGWFAVQFCLVVSALVPLGCNNPTSSSTSATATGGTKATGSSAISTKDAEAFSKIFLQAMREEKADEALLTKEFKAYYAPPELEAEQAQGYSAAAATQNLKLDGLGVNAADITVKTSGQSSYVVSSGKTVETTLLRIVKQGNDQRVDWLAVATNTQAEIKLNDTTAPAEFTVQAFLTAVQTRKFRHLEGLLTEDALKTLGKSTFGDGFDRGAFKNNIEGSFSGLSNYTLKASTATSVTVEWAANNKKNTTVFNLKPNARNGEPLIQTIETK